MLDAEEFSGVRERRIVSMLGVLGFCLNIRSSGVSPAPEPRVLNILDPEDGPRPISPVPGALDCSTRVSTSTEESLQRFYS